MSEAKASKTLTVNCESHFWIIKEFVGKMLQKNDGHIVTIASLAGTCGNAGMTDYCASKAAAYGFSESLRIEMRYLKKNIIVTTINPGFINTGMFKGAKESLLWPLLDERAIGRRVVQAIRQNEGEVSIYWLQGILIFLCKCIMNSYFFDMTLYILNGFDTVANKNFVGRQGKNDPLDKCKKISD